MLFTRQFPSNISGKNATVSHVVPLANIPFETFSATELLDRKKFLGEERSWRPNSHYESGYLFNKFRPNQTEAEWKVESLPKEYNSDVKYRKSTLHGFKLGEIYRCTRFYRDRLDFHSDSGLERSVWFGRQKRSLPPMSEQQWTATIEKADWYEENITREHIEHVLGGKSIGLHRLTYGFQSLKASFRTVAAGNYELILFGDKSTRVELQIS